MEFQCLIGFNVQLLSLACWFVLSSVVGIAGSVVTFAVGQSDTVLVLVVYVGDNVTLVVVAAIPVVAVAVFAVIILAVAVFVVVDNDYDDVALSVAILAVKSRYITTSCCVDAGDGVIVVLSLFNCSCCCCSAVVMI